MSVLVELCAGSAAVSLRWLSSRAKPPIGYQGGKRGYAGAILAALGEQPGGGRRDGRVVLVEPGPWGEAWALWRTAEGRRDTCERLRAWAGEDPRELWERLRAAAVPTDASERVATWAVLSIFAFGGKPVFSDRTWIEHGFLQVGDGRRFSDPTIEQTIARLAALPDLSRVQVIHADALECEPLPGALVYIDPPYDGTTTGYGHALPRADVLALADRWRDAGAVVAVSEAEPLPLDGWHHHALPKPCGVVRSWSKQQREFLTISREPRGQQSLFGGAA